MTKYIGSGLVGLGLLLSVSFIAMPAQAAGLTEAQIQAVVNLVASFGADATTVSNVEASLRGQAVSGTAGSSGGTGGSTASCVNISANLSVGSTGGDVSSLQAFLGVETTGYFGSKTQAAVRAWQTSHGISAVGAVGPATRAAMACR